MPDNNSDQLIRNKLRDHVSSVPADMWERVRQKKEKDRKLVIFWIGCFIACFSFLIYFAVSHFINNHFTGNPIISTHFAKAKNPVVIANPSSARTLVLTAHPPTPPSALNDSNSTSKTRTNIAWPGGHYDHTSPRSAKSVSAKDRIVPTAKDQQERAIATGTAPDIATISDPNDLSVSTPSAPSMYISPLLTQHRKTAIVALSPHTAQSSSSASSTAASPVVDSPRAIETPGRKYRNWYLDIYGSPDLPLNRISSADPFLAQYLKGSSKMQLSYSLGFSLSKSFNKHFLGTIALQYSRINGTSLDSNIFRSPEHFNSIDIPLLAGYQWGDDHIRWSINTGIVYNLYTRYSSELYGPSADSLYKYSNGVSIYLGLNYARQLDKKWFLFAEPYFRYRLSNMATDSQPFNRKINTAGISIGLRYYFKMPVH